jgi:hypothetical protein
MPVSPGRSSPPTSAASASPLYHVSPFWGMSQISSAMHAISTALSIQCPVGSVYFSGLL